MPNSQTPLSRYLQRQAGAAIGKAIRWYVSRDYTLGVIINRLIDRGFQAARKTIATLVGYFSGNKINAQLLLGVKPDYLVWAAELNHPGNDNNGVRVTYRIISDDDSFEREQFGNLIADCPDGLTREQLLECIYQNADNFINYFNYEIKAYHVKIDELEAF